jgi:hypothetical protein
MMSYEESFFSLWNRIEGLEIPEPVDHTICAFALSFQRWIDVLFKMLENPTLVGINQEKILLTDKYFDWERLVPQSHRQRLGTHGHTCVYQVYKSAYEQLRVVEISMTPPLLFLPQIPIMQPNPPQPPNFLGLVLGEDSNTDDE